MSYVAPSGSRRALALGLLIALVLGLVVTGVLFQRNQDLTDKPYSWSNDGDPVISDSDRARAVGVAEQFALRVDGVDTGDLDGYIKSVSEVLTTKFRAKFLADAKAVNLPSGGSSTTAEKATGKVYVSAVSSIDTDSATVLVAHDQQFNQNGQPVSQGFRWVISLRKVDGRWLVDGSSDIDGNG